MDELDFDDVYNPKRRSNSSLLWNILTVIVLLLVLLVVGVFLVLFVNPNTGINPFPPPTLPVALEFPTVTPTLREVLPPTWTPLPTDIPTETPIPRPTSTLPPTPTFFSVNPTQQAANSGATATPGMPFVVQGRQAQAIPNIAYPDLECNWLGVAGRVFDLRGSPVTGQQVQLGGVLPGNANIGDFNITLTGLAPQYGPGYYEFKLADKPVAAEGTLWLQLLDQAGLPMSEKIYFSTYNDCDKNLVVINFEQVR